MKNRVGRECFGRGREGLLCMPPTQAFEGWAGRKPRERAELLREAYPADHARRRALLGKLITLENGKALSDSRGQGGLRGRTLPVVRGRSLSATSAIFRLRRRRARASLRSTSRPALPCW